MSSDLWLMSPSGSSVNIEFIGSDKHPHRDARRLLYEVTSKAGPTERVLVTAVHPEELVGEVSKMPGGVEGDVCEALALIKIGRTYETLSIKAVDADNYKHLELTRTDVATLIQPSNVGDRAARRYLARLAYDKYSRSILNRDMRISETDRRVLGISFVDLQRNLEVLEAEGYLEIKTYRAERDVLVRPTVLLVREVEKYGAPKEDAVSERDYLASVQAYSRLQAFIPLIEVEYRRYRTSVSRAELESVFRAIAPVVESIAKELAVAHGSSEPGTLGPAIAELHNRGIGGVGLDTQLNHILKFARDLSLHGVSMPEPVLRMASENAFELVPQLGSLFPR